MEYPRFTRCRCAKPLPWRRTTNVLALDVVRVILKSKGEAVKAFCDVSDPSASLDPVVAQLTRATCSLHSGPPPSSPPCLRASTSPSLPHYSSTTSPSSPAQQHSTSLPLPQTHDSPEPSSSIWGTSPPASISPNKLLGLARSGAMEPRWIELSYSDGRIVEERGRRAGR